ncbi:MAG: hypothetical protein WCB11_20005 [Terriglobales bacterium]
MAIQMEGMCQVSLLWLSAGKRYKSTRRADKQFIAQVAKPSGDDLYLSVRSENTVACRFNQRHGMKVLGAVAWKKRTIPGLVYRLRLHQ